MIYPRTLAQTRPASQTRRSSPLKQEAILQPRCDTLTARQEHEAAMVLIMDGSLLRLLRLSVDLPGLASRGQSPSRRSRLRAQQGMEF